MFKITRYTIIELAWLLPIMNLGASVTIVSISVTISEVAANCQGPH